MKLDELKSVLEDIKDQYPWAGNVEVEINGKKIKSMKGEISNRTIKLNIQ